MSLPGERFARAARGQSSARVRRSGRDRERHGCCRSARRRGARGRDQTRSTTAVRWKANDDTDLRATCRGSDSGRSHPTSRACAVGSLCRPFLSGDDRNQSTARVTSITVRSVLWGEDSQSSILKRQVSFRRSTIASSRWRSCMSRRQASSRESGKRSSIRCATWARSASMASVPPRQRELRSSAHSPRPLPRSCAGGFLSHTTPVSTRDSWPTPWSKPVWRAPITRTGCARCSSRAHSCRVTEVSPTAAPPLGTPWRTLIAPRPMPSLRRRSFART